MPTRFRYVAWTSGCRSYLEQMRERGPVRELSLREAIELPLAHNLEIEIENYGRGLPRSATASVSSYYDPQFGLSTLLVSSPTSSR